MKQFWHLCCSVWKFLYSLSHIHVGLFDRLDSSSIYACIVYIIKSSLVPVDSSESSGESVSGFSSSSHSYHAEVEDASSVSISTVREAHRTEAPPAFHKPNALAGSSDKTRPPVAPKPKPQNQTKELPCNKVQYKAFNQ